MPPEWDGSRASVSVPVGTPPPAEDRREPWPRRGVGRGWALDDIVAGAPILGRLVTVQLEGPIVMRRVVDLVGVLIVAGIAVGYSAHTRQSDTEFEHLEKTRAAVERLKGEVVIRSQSGQADVNPRGWSATVVPAWFGGELPKNTLLSEDRPWVEVAPVEHAHWEHPKAVFDVSGHDAAFWYNPALGIVRARVPMMPTDKRTIDAYNRVNNTSVGSLSPMSTGEAVVESTSNSTD